MPVTDREARDLVAGVDAALERVEGMAGAAARETALAAVRAVLDLYGEGVARIVEHVVDQCDVPTEERLAAAFTQDELVSHLLIVHGLHPEDVRARVEGALESVRPYLASHGGNVELVNVTAGTVRLRLHGSCHGCPSSSATLRTTVEDAILRAAPEVMRVETEDESPAIGLSEPTLVPIIRARHSRDRQSAEIGLGAAT